MKKDGFRLIGLLLPLVLLSMPMHALAAGKDCPFVGSMESFEPTLDPDWTTYTQLDFRTDQGAVTKKGKLCYQSYALKPGQP
ncbi:MAG TPA: hypothetical protein VK753_11310, partial [Xanthomonadaceae bacterium]|nr:hypothetical protein [Xanthomonadaceae bacterium]